MCISLSRTCFAVHVIWCIIYIVIGSVQLVGGVIFFIHMPILTLGSNIWIGLLHILLGLACIVHTLIGDWTYKKQVTLLYVSIIVLCANAANIIILEVGEWHLFLSESKKRVIYQKRLHTIVLFAHTIITITSILGMVISFIASQCTFCSLQIYKKSAKQEENGDILSDNEYVLPRVKTDSYDDKESSSYFSKPQPQCQSWVYDSAAEQQSAATPVVLIPAIAEEDFARHDHPAKQEPASASVNLVAPESSVVSVEHSSSPVLSRNGGTETAASKTAASTVTIKSGATVDTGTDRKLNYMASFSPTPSPIGISDSSSQESCFVSPIAEAAGNSNCGVPAQASQQQQSNSTKTATLPVGGYYSPNKLPSSVSQKLIPCTSPKIPTTQRASSSSDGGGLLSKQKPTQPHHSKSSSISGSGSFAMAANDIKEKVAAKENRKSAAAFDATTLEQQMKRDRTEADKIQTSAADSPARPESRISDRTIDESNKMPTIVSSIDKKRTMMESSFLSNEPQQLQPSQLQQRDGEKQRLQEEKRRLEEEKEKQRQLEEEKEKQRQLEEEKEKQRQLEEEKEKQRQLEEEKEKQRQLEEEKEKQRQLEEAKEKQRQLEEAKEKQRQLEEAKEKQRLEEEREKQRLEREHEMQQLLQENATPYIVAVSDVRGESGKDEGDVEDNEPTNDENAAEQPEDLETARCPESDQDLQETVDKYAAAERQQNILQNEKRTTLFKQQNVPEEVNVSPPPTIAAISSVPIITSVQEKKQPEVVGGRQSGTAPLETEETEGGGSDTVSSATDQTSPAAVEQEETRTLMDESAGTYVKNDAVDNVSIAEQTFPPPPFDLPAPAENYSCYELRAFADDPELSLIYDRSIIPAAGSLNSAESNGGLPEAEAGASSATIAGEEDGSSIDERRHTDDESNEALQTLSDDRDVDNSPRAGAYSDGDNGMDEENTESGNSSEETVFQLPTGGD